MHDSLGLHDRRRKAVVRTNFYTIRNSAQFILMRYNKDESALHNASIQS